MAATDLSPGPQPIHKAAQRFRWFLGAFVRQVETTEAETGVRYSVDRARLGAVFADWLRAFNAQKPEADADNPAYVGFAAGLMLRALVTTNPVTVLSKPAGADDTNPAYFWPEGYLYVAFCLNVRGLVLETAFAQEQTVADAVSDGKVWWSFKENTHADPSRAIAFLDLFAGDAPDWTMPQIFRSGRAAEMALRFYEPRRLPE